MTKPDEADSRSGRRQEAGDRSPPGEPGLPTSFATESAETGLPVFRTWRGVYLFVLGVLVVWVGLLAALTRMYS
jgi:hypothetical protein